VHAMAVRWSFKLARGVVEQLSEGAVWTATWDNETQISQSGGWPAAYASSQMQSMARVQTRSETILLYMQPRFV